MTAPTLLVADDDSAVLSIVTRIADRTGFRVDVCSDGREAVERLSATKFDMALLDLRMPELGGLEVLRTIRKADAACEVVLMSGDPTLDSAVEAVKLGALDYLQKPRNLQRLETILTGVREDNDRRRRPLRDRREDIAFLVGSFVRENAQKLKKPIAGLSPAAEGVLFGAAWEGNIRELRNLVERACIMADGEFLSLQDVTPARPQGSPPRRDGDATAAANTTIGGPERLSVVERDHILSVLRSTHGNKAHAARLLGVSRRAIYRKLERPGLDEEVAS